MNRWLVEGVALVVPLIVTTRLAESSQLVKAVVLALVALASLAVWWLERAWNRGRVPMVFTVTLGAFSIALLATAAVSGLDANAMLGPYARWTGVTMYLAVAAIAWVLVGEYGIRSVVRLSRVMLISSGVVAVYLWLQHLGVDPFPWKRIYGNDAFGTLGNPNFAAAFLGMAFPFWIGRVLDTTGARRWSFSAGAALLVGGIAWTGSLQGWIVSGLAVGFLLFVWFRDRPWGGRARVALVTVGLAGTAAVVAGIADLGPLARLGWTGMRLRFGYWKAALGMGFDNPLLGLGPTGYADNYRRYRTLAQWADVGTQNTNDAAHSVPLQMFANGGVLLLVSYVALWAVIGWFLVRAAKRSDLSPTVVGAFGGAWLGYVAQAFIGIDVPPIALAGWLAGAVLVVLGADGQDHVGSRERYANLAFAVIATIVLAVGATVFTLQAVADGFARRGLVEIEERPSAALEAYARATSLTGWEPRYPFGAGNAMDELGDLEGALGWYERAARTDPDWWDGLIASARLSAYLGHLDRSADWYRLVLDAEPIAPDMKFEAGRVEYLRGNLDEAERLLTSAVADAPAEEEWLALLDEVERSAR